MIIWNAPDMSPYPAIAHCTALIHAQETTPNNFVYLGSIDCQLRGDVIPGFEKDSPAQQLRNPEGVLTWPSVNLTQLHFTPPPPAPGPFPPPPGLLPTMTVRSAVAAGDLSGSGTPSIAAIWSANWSELPSAPAFTVTILLDVGTDPGLDVTKTITATVPTATPDVQCAAVANRRLFLMADWQLMSAKVDASSGSIGSFVTHSGWEQRRPASLVSAAMTAADFSGSGRADLLFFYAVADVDPDGAITYRAVHRIAYELDDNGDPSYWGDEIAASVPVSDQPTSLVLGPLDPQTTALRQATAQAFRAAAAATQARLTTVIPAVSSPPPQPSVDTAALASAVRAGVDPVVTVPASVSQKLSVPAPLAGAGGDELQPIAFTPSFPQPFYETVRDGALWRLVPGLSSFPDESITVLSSNSHEIEAVMVGANHELSRELLWRGVPALRTATSFARFWDGRDASGNPLPDITDIASWDAAGDLGSHAPSTATPADAAILLMRGELIRRFPHLTIYAAPAMATSSGSRTVDLTHSVDPVFTGALGRDSKFVGFPFTVQTARSGPGQLGMYFVFQEHPMAPRFGLNLDMGQPSSFGTKPDVWRDLDWAAAVPDAATYDALMYLDASASSPLWGTSLADVAGAARLHRWGFSAAHMAHICYRPPVLIAIHADELLPAASGASG
jgi:hypothetical protein